MKKLKIDIGHLANPKAYTDYWLKPDTCAGGANRLLHTMRNLRDDEHLFDKIPHDMFVRFRVDDWFKISTDYRNGKERSAIMFLDYRYFSQLPEHFWR